MQFKIDGWKISQFFQVVDYERNEVNAVTDMRNEIVEKILQLHSGKKSDEWFGKKEKMRCLESLIKNANYKHLIDSFFHRVF